MKTVHFALLTILAIPLQGPPEKPGSAPLVIEVDPIELALMKSKETCNSEVAAAGVQLLKEFDGEKAKIGQRKDYTIEARIHAQDDLDTMKRAFEDKKTLPQAESMKTAVGTYLKDVKTAKHKLSAAYKMAMDGFLQKGNNTRALAILEESNQFLFPDIVSWAKILSVEPDPAVVKDKQLSDRIIATGRPWRVRDKKTTIEMLLVPPGNYRRGSVDVSPRASYDSAYINNEEKPPHLVTISDAFYLSRYEVMPSEWNRSRKVDQLQFEKEVPICVSWNDIQTWFSDSPGLRLPTEAEWEYAARAAGTSTDMRYGFIGEIAWFKENAQEKAHPVGQKKPNGLGMHDMIGNLHELCIDYFGDDEYKRYEKMNAINPTGPNTGTRRVIRGGSWNDVDWLCRVSTRKSEDPDKSYSNIGFRVARNP